MAKPVIKPKIKLLTKKELAKFLKQNPHWSVNSSEKELIVKIKLKNYLEGLTVMARIAVHSELMQHHPEILYTYNSLTIKVSTHDVKGLTKLDTELAERLEKIFK